MIDYAEWRELQKVTMELKRIWRAKETNCKCNFDVDRRHFCPSCSEKLK